MPNIVPTTLNSVSATLHKVENPNPMASAIHKADDFIRNKVADVGQNVTTMRYLAILLFLLTLLVCFQTYLSERPMIYYPVCAVLLLGIAILFLYIG